MLKKVAAFAVVAAAVALAACAGQSGGNAANGASYSLPGMPDLHITATISRRFYG